MVDATEVEAPERESLRLSESQLRRSAAYQKHRLAVAGVFIVATVICGFSFEPLGHALGVLATGLYDSMMAGGTSGNAAGLAIMLGANAIGFIIVLLLSFFVGPRVPSGLPHVVLGILVPLSLATMQAELFRQTGGASGLADTEFARWSFVAMFLITLVTAEISVIIGRRRLEKREG
ncbi:MAG: hypothetical protein Q7J82_10095 [Coriobacteriia bacterium]|nr:hypothetical protein [Coriobacteriia bacterium]